MIVPEPEYAQNIIVGVIFQHTFAWYVTDKEYWYLDYLKFDRALFATGYKKISQDYSDRFGIAILDEKTIEQFLGHITDSRISSEELSDMMVSRKTVNKQDDLLDFAPCLLVNFDEKQLSSQYPEMIRFERYVPDGWTGVYRDFLAKVPKEEQYWIVNGQNLFKHQ